MVSASVIKPVELILVTTDNPTKSVLTLASRCRPGPEAGEFKQQLRDTEHPDWVGAYGIGDCNGGTVR